MSFVTVTFLAILAATGYAPVAAPAALVLLCWWPGRIIMAIAGIGQAWDRWGRAGLAVILSLVFLPVLLHPIWHLGNGRWFLLGAVWGLLISGLLIEQMVRRANAAETPAPSPALRFCDYPGAAALLALVGLLVVVATIGTYWPNELRGMPMPSGIHDFIKHHAVLYSLEHRPLPLGNPFYAAEASGPVYYYDFFYLIPATVRVLAKTVSIELAFGIQAAMVALSAVCCLYLIVKRFTGGQGPALLAVVLATVVGGLDVLPLLAGKRLVVTLDAWADPVVRIPNLLNQMIWSPQNVLGLLVLLVVVYLLSEKNVRRGWLVLGPAAGVAAWGSSPWLAIPLFAGFGAWWLWEGLVRRKVEGATQSRLIGGAAVGMMAAVLSAPILAGYAEMSHRHGKSLTTQWPYQWHAFVGRLAPPGPLANLLDLPWVLALELGALVLFPLLLVPRASWRKAWNDDGLRLLLICALVTLVGYLTVRSHFLYNDFGQKSMMVVMAAGIVLGACAVRAESGPRSLWNPFGWRLVAGRTSKRRAMARVLFAGLLIAGCPMGLYEAPLTVVRRYLPPHGPLVRLVPSGARQAAMEGAAYLWMSRQLPRDAVVQADPGPERVTLLQVVRRQVGVMVLEADTMVFHPMDGQSHDRLLMELKRVLYEPASADALHGVLRDCLVTHVFVGTAEKAGWKCLNALEDGRFFEPVLRQGGGTVYLVKQVAGWQ